MQPNGQPQPPQKLLDFNADLKALCEKYQYELKATLQIAPDSTAIVATLQVFEVSPKTPGIPLQPAAETNHTTEPVQPEPLDSKQTN